MLASASDWMTVLMASQKRKHNTCRADLGGCVSDYACINRDDALGMCVQTHLKVAIGHRLIPIHRIRHKADRLAIGVLRLLLPAACGCLVLWSVHGK